MVLYKRVAVVLAVLVAALVFAVPAFAQGTPAKAHSAPIQPMVGCSGAGCWPTYSYRDLDTDVTAAQYLLLYHGAYRGSLGFQPNGNFGTQTVAAVKFFQSAEGLPVTGTINARTWRHLVTTVRYGQRSKAVKALQVELRSQYGYRLPVTGYYGNQTRAAVRNFNGGGAGNYFGAGNWRPLISAR